MVFSELRWNYSPLKEKAVLLPDGLFIRAGGHVSGVEEGMQGKSCFNFTATEKDCFAELGRLTAAGLKKFKSKNFRQSIQQMQ
jgi:hypothetical protein